MQKLPRFKVGQTVKVTARPTVAVDAQTLYVVVSANDLDGPGASYVLQTKDGFSRRRESASNLMLVAS